MFSTATRNFVEEIDDGSLIPVSSLIDSDKLVPLSLVVKRKRFWIWQKPKYLPTDFTLSDVLTGDTPLTPVVVKTDFLKYQGTFGDNKSGNFESNLVAVNLKVEGKDTSKLQSSFGSLKKEEVDVQKLLRDSKDKLLDMSHCLMQQTREKTREVFGVVKERIVTTQPCSVIEEVQQGGQLEELLSFCGPKSTQVSVKENSSLHKDSNVSLEIPAHTVIAYCIIELEIKLNGHYELCLMSDTLGGFEVDGPVKKSLVGVPGAHDDTPKKSCFQRELEKLSGHFQLLSVLPAATRSSLLQLLKTTMEDREAVSVLESVLDQMCTGKTADLGEVKEANQMQTVQAILDLLEHSDSSPTPSLLSDSSQTPSLLSDSSQTPSLLSDSSQTPSLLSDSSQTPSLLSDSSQTPSLLSDSSQTPSLLSDSSQTPSLLSDSSQTPSLLSDSSQTPSLLSDSSQTPSLLSATHLIISAMDGMTDEGLSVLGPCCSPPVLQALQILVQHVAAGSGETLSLRDAGLAVLTEEEVFGRTESLFGHSKVTLKREQDTLRTEMKDQPGYLPLVMSITVKGLASLV
ncbi:gasdermin-E [Salmo salar]|uniref:Gasdermin-E-like n=1 Tax=Salmo salar TaxID=8030 RepID=A0ABM3D2Q5_SALSA|nr:gasdermin-E-like [Salmo salar]XP_045553082.1 gasdermin-E-like [Salmo salar]XP_045553085.1 gasdermin-E-like [Salmo salar]XP_045553088.1 gasdermin-E-like [Salmo salar]